MKSIRAIYLWILSATLLATAGATAFALPGGGRHTRDIPKSHERELKVSIDAGMSDLTIGHSSSTIVLSAHADLKDNQDSEIKFNDCIEYEIRDDVGYLDIATTGHSDHEQTKKSGIHFGNFESTDWMLNFTDAIPIAFDIEFGLGDGDIDLSGLAVKDLRLSTGASSVKLRFDKPNREVIEDLTIEAGLSKFKGINLGNANFNHLTFEGGVGSYQLDFSGELSREADVDIEVGLGALTIVIPANVEAKIYYERSWVAHLTIDKEFVEREEDTYYTPGYSSGRAKLNLNVTAGLGSVTVTRAR